MKNTNILLLLILLFSLSLVLSCDMGQKEAPKVQYSVLKDVPPAAWKKLSKKKIYFGHQSVGFNIMNGIKDIMKEHPEIELNIVEAADKSALKVGVFAHSRVGSNRNPESKMDAFAQFMDEGLGNTADIAFMKFCYVDITKNTDADKIFNDYKRMMSEMEKKYPGTAMVHLSVPITIIEKENWKSWLKGILGREVNLGYEDNIKRNEINALLKKEYEAGGRFFDLAKIESIYPDGKSATFERDGKTYNALAPLYSYDGQHLNEVGRKKAAEQLLLLLVNLD